MTSSILDEAVRGAFNKKAPWLDALSFLIAGLILYYLDFPTSTNALAMFSLGILFYVRRINLVSEIAIGLLSKSITSNREFLLKELERRYERMSREKAVLQTRLEQLEKLDERVSSFLFMVQLKEDIKKSQETIKGDLNQ